MTADKLNECVYPRSESDICVIYFKEREAFGQRPRANI